MVRKHCRSAFFLLAAACAVAAKPVHIWVNSETDQKYYRNMIELYREKVDPKFQAEIRNFGFTEMPDKLSIAIKTGVNAPDIVQIDELYFSMFLDPKGMPFLDLTDRIRKSGLDKGMLRQRMGLFEYQGKYYGLPQSVSAVLFYYRDDVFEDLKISPKSIDTWEKFIEVGKKIQTPGRKLLAMDWSYFEILLRQRGYELFNPDGTDRLLDPVTVETLAFLERLVEEGVGEHPDRGSIFEPTFFGADILNNEVIGIIGAGWYGLDMIQNFSPKELHGKWRAMPLPLWTDGKSNGRATSTFSGQGLVIFKKSRQADKSWDFIRFVMEDREANVQRYLQGNCITPFKPAWLDTRFNRPDSVFGGQSLGALTLQLASQIPSMQQSPHRALVVNLLREKYWYDLMTEAMGAEQVLKEIQAEIRKERRKQ